MMQRLVSLIIILIACGVAFSSCQSFQSKYAAVERERDSLLIVTAAQDSTKDMIEDFLETIAVTLDSIRITENMLSMPNREGGKTLSRNQIREKLKDVDDIIKRQRERIAELEAKLALTNSKDSTSYYRSLISNLYAQLDAKDAEIAQIQNELNRQILVNRQLTIRVDSLQKDNQALSAKNQELDETVEFQKDILYAQDVQMNTCFVKIGTRKELQAAGLLETGLFKGNTLNLNQFGSAGFEAADMRDLREIKLSSSRPKILTSHPGQSYSLYQESYDSTILKIEDPGSFWSLSNYLIIQL